jgi:hypothetical protein
MPPLLLPRLLLLKLLPPKPLLRLTPLLRPKLLLTPPLLRPARPRRLRLSNRAWLAGTDFKSVPGIATNTGRAFRPVLF